MAPDHGHRDGKRRCLASTIGHLSQSGRPRILRRVAKCRTGKIAYPTATSAGKALRETQGKGHGTTAYVCPHCRRWHLTTSGTRRASSDWGTADGSTIAADLDAAKRAIAADRGRRPFL